MLRLSDLVAWARQIFEARNVEFVSNIVGVDAIKDTCKQIEEEYEF